jgi:hypothetical protein
MKKINSYRYLGSDGSIIDSVVFLEGALCVKRLKLVADEGKVITKDGIHFSQAAFVSEQDADLYYEIDDPKVILDK